MKQYDKVCLTMDYTFYAKGTIGIIKDIFNNEYCYLDLLDDNNEVLTTLYDVPLEVLSLVD